MSRRRLLICLRRRHVHSSATVPAWFGRAPAANTRWHLSVPLGVFGRLSPIGINQVLKTKAHREQAEAEAAGDLDQWKGNYFADKLASQQAASTLPSAAVEEAYLKAVSQHLALLPRQEGQLVDHARHVVLACHNYPLS